MKIGAIIAVIIWFGILQIFHNNAIERNIYCQNNPEICQQERNNSYNSSSYSSESSSRSSSRSSSSDFGGGGGSTNGAGWGD